MVGEEQVGRGKHQPPGVLVLRPLEKFKDITTDCQNHSETVYHKNSLKAAEGFLKPTVSVVEQMQTGWKKQIQKNRQRLLPIIKTVQFCGRQGMALRGRKEKGELTLDFPDSNDGNFRSPLRLRCNAGDEVLSRHFKTCDKNATYVSPQIQNEIIKANAKLMRAKIVDEVKKSSFFSIICDRSSNTSLKEQLSFVIRYVSENNTICEAFFGF